MYEAGYDILIARRHGVCDCEHWSADHIGSNEGCIVPNCRCDLFAFNLEYSHPERVAQRGEDPSRWPAYVDQYFANKLLR